MTMVFLDSYPSATSIETEQRHKLSELNAKQWIKNGSKAESFVTEQKWNRIHVSAQQKYPEIEKMKTNSSASTAQRWRDEINK